MRMEMTSKTKSLIQNNLVLMMIVVLAVITAFVEPKFFSFANLGNLMNQFGSLSFVSLGMTIAIIGGFIDLSVAGIVSLSAVFTISMIDPLGQVGALIAGILAGALMGLLNGVIVLQLRSADTGESPVYDVCAQFRIQCGSTAVHGRSDAAYVSSEFTDHAVPDDRIGKSRICAGFFYSIFCDYGGTPCVPDQNKNGT